MIIIQFRDSKLKSIIKLTIHYFIFLHQLQRKQLKNERTQVLVVIHLRQSHQIFLFYEFS